ncbi:C-type lectin domain family 4 member G [Dissostichus eleginoides]|uniref:C-type lectin domain family 4 member G n=1 Tax=Dissostichus eleginoides TaxID=100907 RepID=A0AAD9BVR5_DISEL|nr:C-type lectin domain family 4 member G [Dissostichus eleginoides]
MSNRLWSVENSVSNLTETQSSSQQETRVVGCCPLDWTTFQSSCYLFSRTLLSWDEAKAWCNDHESHLVIILSDEEWVFVKSHSTGTYYWVV